MKKQNRSSAEVESLREEVRTFRDEKEKIRSIIGQIGGTQSKIHDRIANIAFILFLVTLLGIDILRHVFQSGLFDWLPQMLSLEIGVLLVSLKIIWMIYKQTKVEHFQFWILNSIEFRLNEVAKKLSTIEKKLKENDD